MCKSARAGTAATRRNARTRGVMRMDRSIPGSLKTRGVGRSYRMDQAAELWRDCVGISLSIPETPKIARLWRNIRSFSARFALNGTETDQDRLFSADYSGE